MRGRGSAAPAACPPVSTYRSARGIAARCRYPSDIPMAVQASLPIHGAALRAFRSARGIAACCPLPVGYPHDCASTLAQSWGCPPGLSLKITQHFVGSLGLSQPSVFVGIEDDLCLKSRSAPMLQISVDSRNDLGHGFCQEMIPF